MFGAFVFVKFQRILVCVCLNVMYLCTVKISNQENKLLV